MYQLRPYQQDAVDSLFSYFEKHDGGNPLVVLPTGAGKSLVLAEFIRRTIGQWPNERFLLLTHVKELLIQNHEKIAAMAPHLHVGLYSAGLGRKKVGRHVTVAGIQSVHKKAHELGDVSIVIIDEAHLVSKNSASMYRSFLESLRKICPSLRLVGLSATPFRLDSGPLHKGKDRIFTDIAYSTTILDLIKDGFLSPLVTAPTTLRISTRNVAKRGGEFIAADLAACVDRDEITRGALDQVMRLCADRKSWLVFCVGVEHAEHVTAALVERGVRAEIVVGDTPRTDRAARLAAFKRGEIRALVSVGVLTTGFDAPNADALVCLRPTMSPGLFVQLIGRGTRPSPGKTNCLVLDFTSNTRQHGPVDTITIDSDGNVKSADADAEPRTMFCPVCEADTRVRKGRCLECGHEHVRKCPECATESPLLVPECATCGFVWPREERELRHDVMPTAAPILSSDKSGAVEEEVTGWQWARHRKEGKPDSVCVTYMSGWLHLPYREWLCFDHGGYAADKASVWWQRHGGKSPSPRSVTEALDRKAELVPPAKVRAVRDGKYWRVTT